jgi:hypothetical protein
MLKRALLMWSVWVEKTGDEHPLGRTSYVSVCPWVRPRSEASACQSFHGEPLTLVYLN